MLGIRLHLDLALVGVEKLQLLLELHSQALALSLLSLIQTKLVTENRSGTNEQNTHNQN